MKRVIGLGVLLFALSSTAFGQLQLGQPPSKQVVMGNLASQPLCFTENRGQWGEKTLFRAEAGGATFYFCRDEVAYLFTRSTNEIDQDALDSRENIPGFPDEMKRPVYKKEAMLIKAQFVGANLDAHIIGENQLSYNCNYFYGNEPSKWATNVPNYSSITYKDIYTGIDLRYHGDGKGMKYDFIVNPGADLSQIRIHYEGVDNLSISNAGDLEAQTQFGLVYENIPLVYQEISGRKQEVNGRYQINTIGEFGFTVSEYDYSHTLIIDPQLVFSTYLGGSEQDDGYGIDVDNLGFAYITGISYSQDFPTQHQIGSLGGGDAFITKLSLLGDSLIYSTYLGGNQRDEGAGIVVDNEGCAYITGRTYSNNFPTKNPYQTFQGYADVIVAKISPEGDSLIYSTCLGSSNEYDYGYAIAISRSGNACVTGWTYSGNFPLVNPYQYHQYGGDAFVSMLSGSGNSLVFSSYLGGNVYERGYGVAVDTLDYVYVTGWTSSTNFPTTGGCQTYTGLSGKYDAFLVKLVPEGNSAVFSTYLGGTDDDLGLGLAVTNSGYVYVTGTTASSDFPTLNPIQPYPGSTAATDVFITKFALSGCQILSSTYLGGNGYDGGNSIAVDKNGNVYVAGYTWSNNFPCRDSLQPYRGEGDAFVTKLPATIDTIKYCTYIGGDTNDVAASIAVDDSGNAYVAGNTWSNNFPVLNPIRANYGGNNDGFVIKIAPYKDSDGDHIPDNIDNCILHYNPLQEDTDSDSIGDSCDNCLGRYNPLQEDSDSDGIGDACDNCPTIFNPLQEDIDHDSIGNVCDNCDNSYLIGDINGDGIRLGADVTYGVRYFKALGPQPPDSCFMDSTSVYIYVAGDCNGNCEFRGSDITRLVAYFKGTAPLSCCHWFPTELPPFLPPLIKPHQTETLLDE
jgi:hypothetical protein